MGSPCFLLRAVLAACLCPSARYRRPILGRTKGLFGASCVLGWRTAGQKRAGRARSLRLGRGPVAPESRSMPALSAIREHVSLIQRLAEWDRCAAAPCLWQSRSCRDQRAPARARTSSRDAPILGDRSRPRRIGDRAGVSRKESCLRFPSRPHSSALPSAGWRPRPPALPGFPALALKGPVWRLLCHRSRTRRRVLRRRRSGCAPVHPRGTRAARGGESGRWRRSENSRRPDRSNSPPALGGPGRCGRPGGARTIAGPG